MPPIAYGSSNTLKVFQTVSSSSKSPSPVRVDNEPCTAGQGSGASSGVQEKDYRMFSIHRQMYDLSAYYEHKQGPASKVRIESASLWNNFSDFVCNNTLTNADNIAPEAFDFTTHTGKKEVKSKFLELFDISNSKLSEENMNVTFQDAEHGNIVGSCDAVVLYGQRQSVAAIGFFESDVNVPAMGNDLFFQQVLTKADNISSQLSNGEENTVNLTRDLCSIMLVNNCRYGYISTGKLTRMIKIIKMPHMSSSYVPNIMSIEIVISPAIQWEKKRPYTLLDALLALGSQCQAENSLDNDKAEVKFSLSIQTLAEPDVCSLSKFEQLCAGRKKWWKYKKDNDMIASVKFSLFDDLPSSIDANLIYEDKKQDISFGWLWLSLNPERLTAELIRKQEYEFNFITKDDECNKARPVMLKCVSYVGDYDREKLEQLKNEGRVYEYLGKQGISVVSKKYIFGDVLGSMLVLVLEPVGQPIRPENLSRNTKEQIRACVSSLHEYKLLHGDIRLCNFLIDACGRVRIANFGKTKLYNRLHSILMMEEMREVDNMLDLHSNIE